jgi:hypothetical protein
MLNAGSSRSGKESHELPKISIKEPKSSANVLVDVGRARYILEESEQGPLLSEDLKSKCLKYAIQNTHFKTKIIIGTFMN